MCLTACTLCTLASLRWPGDSQLESGRFARIVSGESIRSKKTSQHASDSRESPQTCDSQVLGPRSAIRRRRGSVREPSGDSRESSDSRICENLQIIVHQESENEHMDTFLSRYHSCESSCVKWKIIESLFLNSIQMLRKSGKIDPFSIS